MFPVVVPFEEYEFGSKYADRTYFECQFFYCELIKGRERSEKMYPPGKYIEVWDAVGDWTYFLDSNWKLLLKWKQYSPWVHQNLPKDFNNFNSKIYCLAGQLDMFKNHPMCNKETTWVPPDDNGQGKLF